MLGLWNKILVGLQKVHAIAHRRQVLDLLQKDHAGFDRPSSKDRAEELPKVENTASQSQRWVFFWRWRSRLRSRMGSLEVLGQLVPKRERPSWDQSKEPGRSFASPSLLDWTDLKDLSVGLKTVALDNTASSIINIVRISTVRTLHRKFSQFRRLLHLSKQRNGAIP